MKTIVIDCACGKLTWEPPKSFQEIPDQEARERLIGIVEETLHSVASTALCGSINPFIAEICFGELAKVSAQLDALIDIFRVIIRQTESKGGNICQN